MAGLNHFFRSRIFLSLTLAIALAGSIAAASYIHKNNLSNESTIRLTFLHISDLHANYHPREYFFFGEISPLALIKGHFDNIRSKTPEVLIIDSGDAFEKGSLADLHSRGQSTIELYRDLGIDLMTLGNHDFAYGPEPALDLCAVITTKCILTNHTYKGPTKRAPLPYHEFTHQGIRIGVFGLLTQPFNEMDRPVEVPYNAEFGPRFDLIEVAREVVQAKRGQVDLLILISHMTPSQDKAVANNVPGIDLIFGGHSHRALEQPLVSRHGTLIMNGGCCGQFVGKLVLEMDNTRKQRLRHEFELTEVDPLWMPHDEAFSAKIAQVLAKHAPDAELLACQFEHELADADLATMLAAAAREELKADAVVLKADLVRDALPAGRISRQTLFSRFHVEHQPPGSDGWTNLMVVEMSGDELQTLIRSISDDMRYAGTDQTQAAGRYRVAMHRMYALNLATYFPELGVARPSTNESWQIWRLVTGYCGRNHDKALAGQLR